MAARKTTKKAPAAAKQPEASKPAEKPEGSEIEDTSKQSPGQTGATPSQPGTGESEQSSGAGAAEKESENQSTERGPAKDGNPSDNPEESAGEVKLEVFTRLDRRIRGGVTVTNEKQIVSVTEEVAALIEADPHIATARVTE